MRYLIIWLLVMVSADVIGQQTNTNLNTNWEFRKVGDENWMPAQVPGCVHTDLFKNGVIEDPLGMEGEEKCKWIESENWEYRTTFLKSSLPQKQFYTIKFHGLDTYASVYLNDELILESRNMFRWYEVNVSALLKEENQLRIEFESPVKKGIDKRDELGYDLPSPSDAGDEKIASFVRKAGYQFGWDWGPRLLTSGIWKPVEIISWDSARLQGFHVVQDTVTKNKMVGKGHFRIQSSGAKNATLEIAIPGQAKRDTVVELQEGMNELSVQISIVNPELWWPRGVGSQRLYEVKGSLIVDGDKVAAKTRKIGVRTIELINEPDDIGTSFYFKVNGEPIFMKGANMIPQSVFPSSVSKAETLKLLVTAKKSHMNMLRVWGGGIYHSDWFYNACDSLGILIWQDAMFACSVYPWDDAYMENVQAEIKQQTQRISDHACIATWCGNNEVDVAWNNWGWQSEFKYDQSQQDSIWKGYQKLFSEVVPNAIRGVNPSMNYVSTSPLSNWGKDENFNHHNMHYWGVWHGTDNFDGFEKNIPRFMSEYGFQSFPILHKKSTEYAEKLLESRQKSYKGNKEIDRHIEQYFPKPKTFEDYAYLSQLTQRLAMKTAIEAHRLNGGKCMGTLYWQLNDVWLGPTWSTIDASGSWKAAHYTVSDRYQPTILLPRSDGNKFELFVSNDQLESQELNVKMRLIAFTGEEVWSEKASMTAPKSSLSKLGEWSLKEMMKNLGLKKMSVLEIQVSKSDTVLDKELFYFEKPKDLFLSNVDPEVEVVLMGDYLEVKISSPVLLKDVFLRADVECTQSENFFDVLPGETKVVNLYPKRLVVPHVKLKSLNQTYPKL